MTGFTNGNHFTHLSVKHAWGTVCSRNGNGGTLVRPFMRINASTGGNRQTTDRDRDDRC